MLIVETPPVLPHINCGLNVVEHALIEKNKPSSRKVCFSFAAYAKNVINHMRKCNIPIAAGLTDEDFSNIESTLGFTFPPDLEAILQEGLPVGEGFPPWRESSHAEMRSWLDLPIKALCNEVKCRRFWPSEWGVQPDKVVDAIQIAANELKQAPTLVPVYANCYISCFPVQAGNPVFLVQESTILYCGYDLADFFKRQAFVPRSEPTRKTPVLELHSGLGLIKEQINMQRNALGGTNDGTKATISDYERPGSKDEIKMSFTTAMWRWADESPRIPLDALVHAEVNGEHYYQNVKGALPSLVTPSPPPPTPSPSLSSSSSSSSSPSSRKNSPFAYNHENSSSSSSSSSSPSSGDCHDDQRVGMICKKYLYFHEKPLPSRMLNKFTMAAPPWVAKQARKITFWSDVAEGSWLQPETSSEPATPRTPRRLHADFEYASARQHEKKCTYNHVLERNHSDQTDSSLDPQSRNDPVSEPKSSHQHCNSTTHELASERELDGIQQEYPHSLDDVSTFAHSTIDDQHDYVIHNQPAKRSRGNCPVLERTCSNELDSFGIDPPRSSYYLSSKDDHNNHELHAGNNLYVELNGQHALNYFGQSSEKNSYAWLSGYLNGLADALRRGRWCEADINDMLLQYAPEKGSGAGLHSCLQQAS